MIVVSPLLILVAVALLALGLTGGSSSLLIGSIVASLLAAVALVVGVRRTAARRPGGDHPAADEVEFAPEPAQRFVAEQPPTVADPDPVPVEPGPPRAEADAPRIDADHAGHAEEAALAEEFGEPDADDPDDEPLPQAVSPADAARVARMDAEVLVVDGRPRYHLAECPHLVGRLTEPIGVNEAVELGFSPCGLCRPVDRLVGAATPR